jgi:hypothetical protein
MAHSDILEAIAVINASASIKAHPQWAAIIALLADYAKGTIIGKDIIQYDPRLGPKEYGQSYSDWLSTRINVSTSQMGDIATTAFIISHESVHRVINDSDTIPGELQCRAHDARFGSELKVGITYTSPATGKPATVSLIGSTLLGEIDKTIVAATANKLIDRILCVKRYQDILMANWVAANYSYHEGGLRLRDAATLGHYIRALSADSAGNFGSALVDVLDAIAAPDWPTAKAAISVSGDLSALKKALRKVYMTPVAGSRITAIEKRLGINLKPL